MRYCGIVLTIGLACGLARALAAADGPATAPVDAVADASATAAPITRGIINDLWYHAPHVAQLADPHPATDPIQPLAEQMEDVVGRLSAMKTDAPVQAEQKQVVAGLNVLIKELEQQTKDGQNGKNPNPTKPMSRSVIAGGPGGSGPLHDAQAGTRAWGELPPKEREEILQSQTEGFPAGYESVLASYYSRLAQMQSSSDAEGPATQPAK